jgi:hypothetical protein
MERSNERNQHTRGSSWAVKGRIGDMAAADAWRVMVTIAREKNRDDLVEGESK